ncbi:FAD binding domain-containing protein [Saccharopolyspora sp. HNM0983]|uniref:FAD binding domain-containing protein n=1 Tax=Saccharopolyspora montiporae TaxID=2781240 RepID=A0A929BA56_9PSEU|nr:FAD binding domain-containing protein [Saccharopolyspora sp. HNM0983]
MEFLRPASWGEALRAKADHPEAVPVAGGTDLLVELNFGHRRPDAILDLTRVPELAEWSRAPEQLRIGAGLPYARLIDELGGELPGLAAASRTVGSPQIRNRGTVGGNLASASPAGDALPPLLAGGAQVEVASVRGARTIPADEFCTGVKRNALAADELIAAVHCTPATGPEQFAKVGTRNAMVIAVCSFAISLHPARREVGTGIGSAAPTPRRARDAERLLGEELDWDGRGALPDALVSRFGELVAAAADPVDDVRGSAAYRRHALSVLARRTLQRVWHDHSSGRPECA